MLDQPGVLVCPVAYDCLSLRIIEETGFKLAAHGNYNTAAPLLGLPDIGLITMTEAVGYARNMAAAVDIPVVADIDDGFGSAINVIRATREVIRAGLAGLYIEDQVSPKRCPALGGNRVIPSDEMLQKLKAVFKVREEQDPDFVVIARTHASRAIGLEEGIERGIAYAQAGADVIFVDLGYSDEVFRELEQIVERIGPYAHVLANMTETVGRPLLTVKELAAMGFKIVYYPGTAIVTAAGALRAVFRELQQRGTTAAFVEQMMPFREIGALMRSEEYAELEESLSDAID
jgi:2-methylisocitrate lyase-like PEP mutase family enzyme